MRGRILLILVLVGLSSSCKKDDDKPTDNNNTYDRTEMLSHFADDIIIKKYRGAQTTASVLRDNIALLKSDPTTATVLSCREALDSTYLWWQYIAHLEFGPAEEVSLRGNVNVYPTDTAQIHKNINTGIYDLGTADNTDAKGLPAICYLLYGVGESPNERADYFSNNPDAINYLAAITDDYLKKLSPIVLSWKGDYAVEFKSRKGTDAGSSTSLLYNSLVSHAERYFRDGKLGIPSGKRTLGETLPEKTENYYAGKSMPLAVANLKAIYSFFSASEKVSFYHYLTALNAKYKGQLLADVIDAQFKTAIDKLEAIPDPLSITVDSNMPIIDAAYVEIQKLMVLLKTDVPSALGVLINYQDNDGD